GERGMYCSSCGVAVAQGLSYCNYCGAKVNRADSVIKSPEVKPETLIAAMVTVFVFGLGAITVLMGVMKAVLGFIDGQILALGLLSFLIMLTLEGVFMRLLLRRNRSAEETSDKAPLKERATNELDGAQGQALPEAMPSVTEHTTRAFDPVYTER